MSHLFKANKDTYTSKSKLKTSSSLITFFNTFNFGKETESWDEQLTNGGTCEHVSDLGQVALTVDSTVGSETVRQTKATMEYIPGNSNVLTFATKLSPQTEGIRQRLGLFDVEDGVYFEDDGTDYYCVLRSSIGGTVNEIRVARADWNGDKLDGTGQSGITINFEYSQLLDIEYEWYGLGNISLNFLINNDTITIHTFRISNYQESKSFKTPHLPLRLEITNVDGAVGFHTLYQGSNSLMQDGLYERLGIPKNISISGINTSLTYRTLPIADKFYPLISLRLKEDALRSVAFPTYFHTATKDNTSLAYEVIVNPTLTGAAFTGHPDPNSFVEYDISSTSFVGGTVLYRGYVFPGGGASINIDDKIKFQLARVGMGTISQIVSLCVAVTGSNKDVVGNLTWIEQR